MCLGITFRARTKSKGVGRRSPRVSGYAAAVAGSMIERGYGHDKQRKPGNDAGGLCKGH